MIICTDDSVAPVGYLNLKLYLEPKADFNEDIRLPPSVKTTLDFVNDLSDSVFSDISDIDLSETELESIEKLELEEKMKQADNNLNPLLTYTSNDKLEQSTSIDLPDGYNESTDSIEEGYSYDEMHNVSKTQPLHDHRTIYGNNHGWYFIGGIVGEGMDTGVATEDVMKKLISG